MRSTDERMAAVKQRTNELKRAQQVRRNQLISLSSIAACLVLIVGIGLAMPDVLARMETAEPLGLSGMAGIFGSDKAIGYVMIGILSFVLGVCITILCMHLHRSGREDKPHDRDR